MAQTKPTGAITRSAILVVAIGLSTAAAQAAGPDARSEEGRSGPLKIRIVPEEAQEKVEPLPEWAEFTLANGETGNLLGFLRHSLEHDPDFRASPLMRKAEARISPPLPRRDPARVTVEEAPTDMILGGTFLGLTPAEIRKRLAVVEDRRQLRIAGQGIYPLVPPTHCLAGPLNCGADLATNRRRPAFQPK